MMEGEEEVREAVEEGLVRGGMEGKVGVGKEEDVIVGKEEEEVSVEVEGSFPAWLAGVVSTFSRLAPPQQSLALEGLLAACPAHQLWLLQHRLPDFLYRDFVRWWTLLPPP